MRLRITSGELAAGRKLGAVRLNGLVNISRSLVALISLPLDASRYHASVFAR